MRRAPQIDSPTPVSALGSTIARSSARLACAGKVTYQVQITRALNPWSTEDREYLFGVPSSEINLQPDQLWFGVFLWAKDQTHQAVQTTDKFTIVDSAGDVYHPIPLNPVTNPYAWNSEMLEPGDTVFVPEKLIYISSLQYAKDITAIVANRPARTHRTTVSVWMKRPRRAIQIADPMTNVLIAIALITAAEVTTSEPPRHSDPARARTYRANPHRRLRSRAATSRK